MLQGRLLGGRYRVAKQLGKGGMGVVYSALQEDLQRMVALKVLLDASLVSSTDLARFRQEALSAAELHHPNIVQVTDFQAPAGEPPFIVMELLTGESLQRLLLREPVLPQARAVFIATQILAALGAAHAAGIVHRDIKPGNVFLTSTPALSDLVKVLDFGIAKVLRARDDAPRSVAGAVTGTPAYMAPEQARGQDVDARADVYAVGACLFEMLTGRPPYTGRTAAELLLAIKSPQTPPPLRALAPSVDAHVADVVDRALSKERSGRPASALDMLRALAPDRALAAAAAMPPAASSEMHATGNAVRFSGGAVRLSAADATQRTPQEQGSATLAPITRTQGSPGAPPPHTMTLASPRPSLPQAVPLQVTSTPASPLRGLAIAAGLVVALVVLGVCAGVVFVFVRARQAVARYSPAPSASFLPQAQRVPPTRVWQPNVLPSPGQLVGDDTEDFVGLAMVSRITWNDGVPSSRTETVPVVFDGSTLKVAWQGSPIDAMAFPQAATAIAGKVLAKSGDHTIEVHDGATGTVQASVETPRPIQQICAPLSGRSAWVELTSGQSGMLDVDAPAFVATREAPGGCTPTALHPRSGIFPPHARSDTRIVDGRPATLLVDGNLEISVQSADNADDLILGRDRAGKELWRRQELRSQTSPRVLDVVGGRAFIQDAEWLEEVDARSGQPHWRITLPPNRGLMGVTPSKARVYVSTLTSGMYVVDATSGAVAGRVFTF